MLYLSGLLEKTSRPTMKERTLEDELNPPLSSALVTDPEAIVEEIRGEDVEIAEIQRDLEKNGQTVEEVAASSVTSEEHQAPKPPVFEYPDGGSTAWIMVFGAWLISFSTFGESPSSHRSD